jgi:ABC-type oligopeptide transport system substrate-binding subunit
MAQARTSWRRVGAPALVLGALLALAAPAPSPAAEANHGLSAFGDLAYPAGFQHFAYANPDAPKGGTMSLVGWGGVTTSTASTTTSSRATRPRGSSSCSIR